MRDKERQRTLESPAEPVGCAAGFLRITWMAFGNLALFFCAIFASRQTAPSALDAAYAAIVVGLIFVRWLDIAKFRGQTGSGEPATMAHWRRYALGLVPVAAGLWALMRFAHAKGFV